MDILGLFVWILPLITIAGAFFTSGVKAFRFQRYTLYLLVLFLAFLFDLTSLSFKNDAVDLIGQQITLLALSDFFWRGVRMKNMFLRCCSPVLGVLFLIVGYHDWIVGGPTRVYRFFDSKVASYSASPVHGYYVKIRGILKVKAGGSDKIVLFKKGALGILEQKCVEYRIPEGYVNAEFSYHWLRLEEHAAVHIVGDRDTLWTLADPGPPK